MQNDVQRQMTMIDAVFDTVALLQAATNQNGPAGACLSFVDAGQVRLYVSDYLLAEIAEVLQTPAIRKAFPTLTDELVSEFLLQLTEKGQLLANVPIQFRYPRDPNDEPIINLAIVANAAFLVSRDKDLLGLMQDTTFRSTYPKLQIVDPVSFCGTVRARPAG